MESKILINVTTYQFKETQRVKVLFFLESDKFPRRGYDFPKYGNLSNYVQNRINEALEYNRQVFGIDKHIELNAL